MPKKLKPREISALQEEYLAKRWELIESKVDKASVKLFDMAFNSYLVQLEQVGGKLVGSEKNYNLVRGLDDIYRLFNNTENIPIVKSLVEDMQGTVPLNEKYFTSLVKKDIRANRYRINTIINKRIGIDTNGQIKTGGFVDKFVSDFSLLKKIKKTTMRALTKGKGMQEFRMELKEVVEGSAKTGKTAGLKQYYRNYAHDAFIKVDRLGADLYAKDLGLTYFYWQGAKQGNTRHICDFCAGKIMNGTEWNKVKSFEQLKKYYRQGMDENSNPSIDLGGYACNHRKRFILDSVALQMPDKIINIQTLLA